MKRTRGIRGSAAAAMAAALTGVAWCGGPVPSPSQVEGGTLLKITGLRSWADEDRQLSEGNINAWKASDLSGVRPQCRTEI
jgi:hypothetical protein